MSKKFSPSKGSRGSKHSSSGLQIHFSPGADSDEGSAELVTSIKTLIKSKASSLDSAYNEIADLLRSDTTTLPHKKGHRKETHSKVPPPDEETPVTNEQKPRCVDDFSDPLSSGCEFGAASLDQGFDDIPELKLNRDIVYDDDGDPSYQENETSSKDKEQSNSNSSSPTRTRNLFSQLSASLFEKSTADDEINDSSSESSQKSNIISETLSGAISNISNAISRTNGKQSAVSEIEKQSEEEETTTDVCPSNEDTNENSSQQENDLQEERMSCEDTESLVDKNVHLSDERKDSTSSKNSDTLVSNGIDDNELFQSPEAEGEETSDKHMEVHERSSSTGSLGIVRSWTDGSVDPLTALSLENDDDEDFFYDSSIPKVPKVRRTSSEKEMSGEFQSSLKVGKSEPLHPVVTKSESLPTFPNNDPVLLKQKAESLDVVDDFYDVEPMEDFDGTINPQFTSHSLPNSPTHLTFHANTGLKQAVKRKLQKNAQPKVNIRPLSFSSLTKSAVNHEDLIGDKIKDKPDAEALDGEVLDKALLNKNQSSIPSRGSILESGPDFISSTPWYGILIGVMCLFAYMILPIPSFVSGMMVGVGATCLALKFYWWMFEPKQPVPTVMLEDINALPKLEVPEAHQTNLQVKDDEIVYEGWMNELAKEYDFATYHVSETFSVFLTLQGTMLRLRRPKTNVPKHHVWYEQTQAPPFVHQRHHDLKGCHIFLKPEGLVQKRVWSKKYPICIMLKKPDTDLRVSRARGARSHVDTTIASKSSQQTLRQRTSHDIGGHESPKFQEHKREKSPFRKTPSRHDKNKPKNASGFVFVSKDGCQETLYLFARTCREKEEWFYRLKAAAKAQPVVKTLKHMIDDLQKAAKPSSPTQSVLSSKTIEEEKQGGHSRHGSNTSLKSVDTVSSHGKEMACFLVTAQELLEEYVTYMGHVMPCKKTKTGFGPTKLSQQQNITCDSQLIWTNAIIGRLFFDFLRIGHWKNKVREKIQKKLNKIHVPYFIDQLTMTDIDLGGQLPTIRRASRPFLDDRGLWIDLDIAYGGGFCMTLETKVNLMKLKKSNHRVNETSTPTSQTREELEVSSSITLFKNAVTHSDEEDSAESSSDEEGPDNPPPDSDVPSAVTKTARGAGKKILRIIDTITDSKFFQNATENKYVKRAMENVSNTKLVLHVSVVNLSGVLALNIAPPPTDRLWYGFRTNPTLTLIAKPKVGEREVSMTRVTEWIEKKLALEFQKVWVIPNMDDILIPFMRPTKHEENEDI